MADEDQRRELADAMRTYCATLAHGENEPVVVHDGAGNAVPYDEVRDDPEAVVIIRRIVAAVPRVADLLPPFSVDATDIMSDFMVRMGEAASANEGLVTSIILATSQHALSLAARFARGGREDTPSPEVTADNARLAADVMEGIVLPILADALEASQRATLNADAALSSTTMH